MFFRFFFGGCRPRLRLRKEVFEAFGLHFVLDNMDGGQLKARPVSSGIGDESHAIPFGGGLRIFQ